MMELNTQRMEDFRGRYRYFVAFSAMAFSVILISLWYFQVIKGSDFRQMSANNCIRIREDPAARGMILDRKGRPLAHNRPSFEVYLVPEDLKENPEVLVRVGQMLNMTPGSKKTNTLPAGEDQVGY
jgi:penicillin-binding protein 2